MSAATTARRTGARTELARYTVLAGERILYGQRVDGVVSFLPDQPGVLDVPSAGGEDCTCRPRERLRQDERSDAARQKRPNDEDGESTTEDRAMARQSCTGARVELARYAVSGEDRVLWGQRVLGVVRVTDVPLVPGGRAYLVERGLEEEGSTANATLQALVDDYLRVAQRLGAVPMAICWFV